MAKEETLILGAGLSGLSTAYFLRQNNIAPRIFDKNTKIGGLCCSVHKQGFTFDSSGHLLHFRNKEALTLVKKILKGNLVRHKRDSYVYAFNKCIPFPFQLNFDYLPKKIAKACLSGFIQSRKQANQKSDNFLQWVHNKFGKGIADFFMVPYNVKLWRTPLEKLEYKWAERFVITPTIKQVKAGSKIRSNKPLGYNDSFWYLKRGGIERLVKGFSGKAKNIYLNSQAIKVDMKKKTVMFKDGREEKFGNLISTIPLPELGKIIAPLPSEIRKSFNLLKWVSIYNINLGVKTQNNPPRHWIYFAQRNIPFFRVGFFHHFSSYLAPAGLGALYADVSYTKDRPIRKQEIYSKVVRHLLSTGIIQNESEICCEHINDIKYGYPVYDKEYTSARKKILNYLSENSVISCGRYGSWRYLSMEDVMLEARENVKGIR